MREYRMSFDILIQGCIFYISPPSPPHRGGGEVLAWVEKILFSLWDINYFDISSLFSFNSSDGKQKYNHNIT